MAGAEANTPDQVVIFRVGGTWYALDVGRVREIVEAGPMTVIPGAPAAVRGLGTIRGAAIPVIDLAALFGAVEPASTGTRVVVTLVEGEPVGLLVGDVDEVATVDGADVQPFAVPGHASGAFRGVLQQPGRLVLWVNPDALVPREVSAVTRAA